MPFTLSEAHLEALCKAANFELPAGGMILLGLRGCVPLDVGGTDFAAQQELEYLGTDYVHFRCTLIQWKRGSGFAVYPGSTVPHRSAVQSRLAAGGSGVNQLALGFYRDSHSYYRGDHKAGSPRARHRAFRNDSVLPIWRTADDTDFEGDDRLETTTVPGDNIHCAWQQNAAAATFSSYGCQVIVGRPRVLDRGWNVELGPWAKFVAAAYALAQQRFVYALFSGREVLALVNSAAGSPRFQTVRFGSSGELAEVVQDALIRHGYDLGQAGSDGDFGFASVTALRQFQAREFGASGVDLIVGRQTAQLLGIAWPQVGDAAPPFVPEPIQPAGPAEPVAHPASANGAAEPAGAAVDYRSLVPGGFFSDDPFDLSVKRSIRTNNPGALNITSWQKNFPGYAGITQADHAGNRTTIYVTPEHGVGAWHYLLTDRYGYGETGSFPLGELARRYAGVPSSDHAAAKAYVKGWRKYSGNTLSATSTLRLDNDADMLTLARGMFGHEAGGASPLKDQQIKKALQLKRSGSLPQQ